MGDIQKWIVDRIEGGFAVCENMEKKMEHIPLDHFIRIPKEGDVIHKVGEQLQIDEEERQKREEKIRDQFLRLKKK